MRFERTPHNKYFLNYTMESYEVIQISHQRENQNFISKRFMIIQLSKIEIGTIWVLDQYSGGKFCASAD